jgi:hypothetical protein
MLSRATVNAAGQPIVNTTTNQAIILSTLRRINLNRSLTQYPLYAGGTQTQATYALRFDDPAKAALVPQFLQAQQDRQNFANDIYRTLLAVTGTPPVANPGAPTPQELAPRRWLAQLAVNIVDYIDEDDISTPFNFYNADDGLPVAKIGDPNPNGPTTSILVNGAAAAQATPMYWVFGTELPHVVLNETLAEALDASTTAPPNSTVNLWLELYNPFQAPSATTQQQDGYAVPLYMAAPAGGALQPYSPYRIEVWNGGTTPGAVVAGAFNDNVLGAGTNALGNATPTIPLTFVDSTEFQTPANVLGTGVPVTPQPGIAGSYVPGPIAGANPTDPAASFFLLGPLANPPAGFKDPFLAQGGTPAGTVPPKTAVLRNAKLTYKAPFPAGATDERVNGLTVLLRRLANPHLPPNPNPLLPTGQVNPLYNPYITVDYMDKVPLRDSNAVTSPNGYASRGKRQPYSGLTKVTLAAKTPPVTLQADSPVYDSAVVTLDPTSKVQHTFGQANTPKTSNGVYDWLVHLDRQVISPMELLHVSGYQPYQLTQRFVLSDKLTATPTDKYQHLTPWFDQDLAPGAASHRLYRLFEFLETNNRGGPTNNPRAGRHTGKINLNAIWDFETFQALCDTLNTGGATGGSNLFTTTDVQTIWGLMMNLRSPGNANGTLGVPGPVGLTAAQLTQLNAQYALLGGTVPPRLNRPFLPLATGLSPGQAGGDNQNLNPRGIEDTLLRSVTGAAGPYRLFQPNPQPVPTQPAAHPYQQYELLTKIFNNTTTRSNVFAVWITIGFFDYNPANGQIGAEIGRSEGRHVRHRMFAVVDRSRTRAFSTTTTGPINPIAPGQATQVGSTAYGPQPVQLTTVPVGDPNNTQVITNPFTNMNWAISSQQPPGVVQPLVLVYEPGTANEEVVVASPAPVFPATTPPTWLLHAPFKKVHAKGVMVNCYGHPGPWKRYDPRQDTSVVLHYSIID